MVLAVVRELVCHYRYRALCRVLGKAEPLLKVDLAARMEETFFDVPFPTELLTLLKSVDSPQVVKDADLVRIADALAVSFALWRILCMWHAFAFVIK